MPKLRKDRVHVFSQSIDQKSAQDLIRFITEVNAIDHEKADQFKKYKRRPIQIFLNTNGGIVYDGLGIISAMEWSKTPVHVTIMGRAMSMGLFILASAHHRVMSRHSTLLYHQISKGMYDTIQGLKEDLKEAQRLEKVCDGILFDKTKLTKEDLESYKKQKKDWYITPKEALKLGIVDAVI